MFDSTTRFIIHFSWGFVLIFLMKYADAAHLNDCSDVAVKTIQEIRSDSNFELLRVPQEVLANQPHPGEQFVQGLVKSYTCNVIRQPALWESMFDRKIVALFEAVYSNLEYRDNLYNINDVDVRTFIMLELIQKLLSSHPTGLILHSFAEFTGLTQDQATGAIQSTCGKVASEFGPFYAEVERLQVLSKTDRLIQRLIGNDELFMKLVVVYSACRELFYN